MVGTCSPRCGPNAAGSRIPVLILTAHANEEDRFRAGTDGADAFMTKPFDPTDLVALAIFAPRWQARRPTAPGIPAVPVTIE